MTSYCCHNDLPCLSSISIKSNPFDFLLSENTRHEYHSKDGMSLTSYWVNEIEITLSLWPSALSSLIVISFISFGRRSVPGSSVLTGFMLVDVLASASLLDDDDDSWSIRRGLSSFKCGSITISPAPSCSNFGLLEPESPP